MERQTAVGNVSDGGEGDSRPDADTWTVHSVFTLSYRDRIEVVSERTVLRWEM